MSKLFELDNSCFLCFFLFLFLESVVAPAGRPCLDSHLTHTYSHPRLTLILVLRLQPPKRGRTWVRCQNAARAFFDAQA
ncbi:hypothetical protein FB451DRAFT_1290540 [Mycena latifolia]|nr:hypothetical protein FB451DRAFT_1290540 [Mycena latifolia]